MAPAPFMSEPLPIKEEWLDYNGHLNMAYYNVLFDTGVDRLWDIFGFGPKYRESSGHTTFSAEFHVCYLRELHLGDKVRVSFQILDWDSKRIHFYQELIHTDGWVSATGEGMSLHIDASGPKVAPMPEDVTARVAAMADEHAKLPRPERVGRQMGIRRG